MARRIVKKPFQAYRFIGKNCSWDQSGYAISKINALDAVDIAFEEGVKSCKSILLAAIEIVKTDLEMLQNGTWELDEDGLKNTLKVLNKSIKQAEKLSKT